VGAVPVGRAVVAAGDVLDQFGPARRPAFR